MQRIEGCSVQGEPRSLDIEVRGCEVYLYVHPSNEESISGQEILVPLDKLREAIRPRSVCLAGFSPERRNPKHCEVAIDKVTISIHTENKEWWVEVSRAKLEQALALEIL